jgi:hypothetical protein
MTDPESFKLPSIERESLHLLTNQNNTEGAPGSSFEPGSSRLPLPFLFLVRLAPQKSFNGPNNRSTLIFDHSL